VGFELFDVPYCEKIPVEFHKLLRKELLMFCECGEYELLFTSPLEINDGRYKKIGKITGNPNEKFLNGKDISGFNIRARDYKSVIKYVLAVKKKCDELL